MTPMMFISNVPWWVAVVLAILVWRGWQASTTRTVPFRTIFIGPAIFIGWLVYVVRAYRQAQPTACEAMLRRRNAVATRAA